MFRPEGFSIREQHTASGAAELTKSLNGPFDNSEQTAHTRAVTIGTSAETCTKTTVRTVHPTTLANYRYQIPKMVSLLSTYSRMPHGQQRGLHSVGRSLESPRCGTTFC